MSRPGSRHFTDSASHIGMRIRAFSGRFGETRRTLRRTTRLKVDAALPLDE